ncbi:hypothetical protein PINS_up009320 [Pythium insidiosum]|nr:hypothetical protein PINS_up009320 [Pythium insidiosum]
MVLFFSAATFRGDLETLRIQQRFFPPSVFERSAQIYADPRQIALFTTAFESLRVRGVSDLLAKLSFNVLTCLRWRQIVVALQRQQQRSRHAAGPNGSALAVVAGSAGTIAVVPLPPTANARELRYPRRVIPVVVGYVFLAFGLAVLAMTTVAVRRSTAACRSFPPCVLFKYDFQRTAASCHCLAFVDRALAQDTTAWMNATDAAPVLATLALHGELETVEIVNQRLAPTLPEEMRACRQLRKLYVLVGLDPWVFSGRRHD